MPPEASRVLVTGATGFVGSHTCVELSKAGHVVIGVDNFHNSCSEVLERIAELSCPFTFVELDLRDSDRLTEVFDSHRPDAVIHLAGLKSVEESVAEPLLYFDVNVNSTISLLKVMRQRDVRQLIFSSSCTVYGDPAAEDVPINESSERSAVSPYGRTKLVIEHILEDLASSDPEWTMISLRYFNPVGAHPSGRLGEDPVGTPTNLLPLIMEVATGRRPQLVVNGADYPTADGTCIRDYVHVVDIANGHLAALRLLPEATGFEAINLASGRGSSVLEVIDAAKSVVGSEIPYAIGPRRVGDAAAVYADATRARIRMGWTAERDLQQMCSDHLRWQRNNPGGYHRAELTG